MLAEEGNVHLEVVLNQSKGAFHAKLNLARLGLRDILAGLNSRQWVGQVLDLATLTPGLAPRQIYLVAPCPPIPVKFHTLRGDAVSLGSKRRNHQSCSASLVADRSLKLWRAMP